MNFNEGLSCHVEQVGPIVVFKVVGSESTCGEYMRAAALKPARVQTRDWAAFYFQLNQRHALGTLGYRYDAGYKRARLLEVTLGVCCVVKMTDPNKVMASGALSGDAKARLLKAALELDSELPLMEQLGTKGQSLLCLETEDEVELVMPLSLLERSVVSERLVCEIAPNEFGVAAKMQWAESAEWVPFDEKAFGDNQTPPWAMQ